MQDYLTELAANVAGADIELCAKCLVFYQEFLQSPYRTVVRIVKNDCRSEEKNFVFPKTEEHVRYDVWRAQIKIVYPLLEEYRKGFVEQYSKQIKGLLPRTSPFGEVYEKPEDVELGTLAYLADTGQLSLTKFERDKLIAYKDARNTLSHLGVLSLNEIKKLK